MPTAKEAAALVVQFYETVHNDHDLSIVDTSLSSDAVVTWSGLPPMHGPAAVQAALAADLAGFPSHRMDLEQLIADGDTVASRWTYRGTHTGDYYGIPPTGRSIVSSVVALDRFVDGMVAESHVLFDNYDVMQQLGILPATGTVPA